MNEKRYVPNHLQLETVNGICSARCKMCTIREWGRFPYQMTLEEYATILKRFVPYQQDIQFLSLFGCGEPLFDTTLSQKVEFAKKHGFRGIGISSNCTELCEDISFSLLVSGLDTLICSVDGVTKDVHEKIRLGTDFNVIIENIENFIRIREESGFTTKLILRFVSQKTNHHEWDKYQAFWSSRLRKNDEIIQFKVHKWVKFNRNYKPTLLNTFPCSNIYNRINVISNGDVVLCCLDTEGIYNIGNVFHTDPIEIFNNDIFQFYRNAMENSHSNKLNPCANCGFPANKEKETRIQIK